MELTSAAKADLAQYLDAEPTLGREDRMRLLVAVMEKHLVLSFSDLVMDLRELDRIREHASRRFSSMSMPSEVSNKLLEGRDYRDVAMIEGFVTYLGSHGAIRRMPRFNYTRGG